MSGDTFIQISTAAIALLGAVITYILVPYIRTKTTQGQRDNLLFWVSVAVSAAEQIFAGSGLGDQKKQYALDFLIGKGIKISAEQLDTLIEAAVFEVNQLSQATA